MTHVIVLKKGSCYYRVDVLVCTAPRLARYPSQKDANAFRNCHFATGALVVHVGGHDLIEGMTSLVDDVTEGVYYSMNALSLAQSSYSFPNSRKGYLIEEAVRVLVKLHVER